MKIFETSLSMGVTINQYRTTLQQPLKEMGYSITDVTTMDGTDSYPYLRTNNNNGNLWFSSVHSGSGGNDYFINDYNPELYLALAAMTNQTYGIKGEWWVFIRTPYSYMDWTFGKLYQACYEVNIMYAFEDNQGVRGGFSCDPLTYFRKATKEEIINHFTNKQTTTVMQNSVKVTVAQLKSLYGQFTCSVWKETIHGILEDACTLPDTSTIDIQPQHIELLKKEGTTEQKQAIAKLGIVVQVDKNAFIGEFPSNHMDALSTELFGDSLAFQIGQGAVKSSQSHLIGKSFYMSSRYKVNIHPADGGGTIIEILNKD